MYLDPNILRVLRDSLRREGWPDQAKAHPADKGGLTRGGITAGGWGRYKQLGRPATADELNAITDDQALEYYHDEFVKGPRLDLILDQRLRALMVDWMFTSWDDPIREMQKSLKRRGYYTGAIDGTIGSKTKAALAEDRDPRQLFRDVYNARVRYYVDCAFDTGVKAYLKENPDSQLLNLRGWLNRALEFTP
jgi:lysozyme family protein